MGRGYWRTDGDKEREQGGSVCESPSRQPRAESVGNFRNHSWNFAAMPGFNDTRTGGSVLPEVLRDRSQHQITIRGQADDISNKFNESMIDS